jgi:hypothetical protein
MHNLVQLATHTWLGNQGQLNRWRERFISNLCAEMPRGQHENWQKCQELFPHARAALAQRPQNKKLLEEWALLLYKAAQYAWQRGRAGEAEHMSTVSMEVRRELCGEEGADTLSSMELIGQARDRGGRWKEAELMNRQTLALKETVLGRGIRTRWRAYTASLIFLHSCVTTRSVSPCTKEHALGITLFLGRITQPLVRVANIMLRLECMQQKPAYTRTPSSNIR